MAIVNHQYGWGVVNADAVDFINGFFMSEQADTIFALSTVSGRAALAVIRLSGAGCDGVLAGLGVADLPKPRLACVRRLSDPRDGRLLDEALVLRFVAPHSFTGEDMVEVHVHGGLAVTQAVLAALAAIEGVSPATGGAFTRRAVLNGKMDLTAAEAIADLIDAEGGAQQAQALKQMDGALRQRMEAWRDKLKTMLAHIEADIEFADEDLPGGLGQQALGGLAELRAALAAQVEDRRGIVLRDGVRIALLGPPNAGKSSILNMLAGREAAIVSARAGTTRDVIEVAMQMQGVPVTLIDTAGLRAAGDDIEREGVKRAQAQAAQADIRLWVRAPDTLAAEADNQQIDDIDYGPDNADLTIYNKADLGPIDGFESADAVVLSTIDRTGEEALLAALLRLITEKIGDGEAPIVTRERHRVILAAALAHLDRAAQAADEGLELAAEDLRLAQRELGRITGAVDVEQLLDVVFADFCIGK